MQYVRERYANGRGGGGGGGLEKKKKKKEEKDNRTRNQFSSIWLDQSSYRNSPRDEPWLAVAQL